MKQTSLRKQLELFTVAVVVITTAIFFSVFLFNQSQNKTQLRDAITDKQAAVSYMIVSRAQEKMEKHLFAFTRDTKLLSAIRSGDKQGITDRANTTAILLEATGVVSNIRILSPSQAILFTREASESGRYESRLVAKAIADMDLVRGIDTGASGRPELHFILPIAPRGKLLAVVDMALDYAAVVEESAKVSLSDLVLYSTDNKKITESKPGLADQLAAIEFDVAGTELDVIEQDGKSFNVASLHMKDNFGKNIGFLVSITDETEMKQAENMILYGSGLAVLIWLVVAFIGIKLILINAFKPLEGMKAAVQTIQKSGELSTRIPVQNTNEIGQATNAINELIELVENTFKESNSVMNAVAKGDFSRQVNGNFHGEFKVLQEAVNQSTQSVQYTMDELIRVVKALENGDLSVRMDAKVQGDIRHSVDDAMTSMQAVVDDINNVLEHMAKGDFSHQVKATAHGEFKRLADSVNSRVKQTSTALQDISNVIEGIADGDITRTVKGNYEGKFGEVASLLDSSTRNLSSLIGQTATGVRNLVDNVNQIYQGAMDLNDRTQQQAASLEETTAMMSQITEGVKQTTDNARSANQLASSARNQADEGAEIMRSTIESMGDIREASHKIEEIIGLIDSIAFQTNLLALNAAVEAARAGEHGRGFAVVAGEVRNLAGKSADAARDIKGLIENAVAAIDQGTERAEHSDQALQGIIEAIRKVSDIVAEITAASNEQTNSISQIGHAVSEIDGATQQNAALVEETTAASESMKDEAGTLNHLVAKFKIK